MMSTRLKRSLSALLVGITVTCTLPPLGADAAAPALQATVPSFPVTVNGTVLDVTHAAYPLLLYRDITYFPMTWNNTTALGLSVAWDPVNGLSLSKKAGCEPVRQDLTAVRNDKTKQEPVMLAPFPVTVNGQKVDNAQEPYPVLLYRNMTYFPMTWRFTHDAFGWTTSWTTGQGFGLQACGSGADVQAKQADALNLANGGQLAVQGDWLYMNPAQQYSGPNQLVKKRMDGSGEVKLADDNARYIQLADDWIYYTSSSPDMKQMDGILKIKPDGSQRTVISAAPTNRMWVAGERIYYTRLAFKAMEGVTGGGYYSATGIHSMNKDGTDDTELVGGSGEFDFFIHDDRIYFLMQESETGPSNLYVMSTDGTQRTKLAEGVSRLSVLDGWLFYVKNGMQLNKLSLDGKVDIPLLTSDQLISGLHYRQGWLYFIHGSFGIMGSASIEKMRIDGTERSSLVHARATSLYLVDDDTLYFPQSYMGDNRLERFELTP
ncbi:DUF5050 domain-containing protein [Paenibacillus validus]|uniref:DUF5050 domain-containing protein n=1 Tax=Paenibacillus validus TaxID=44253 RepID=A0A7X2ZDZ4_9BACL|nr:DUF5050 domain-containing protein [Paenibacillus validus]MUG73112.1 DUF5050 domain-containing protein [Paenibacillus validus]